MNQIVRLFHGLTGKHIVAPDEYNQHTQLGVVNGRLNAMWELVPLGNDVYHIKDLKHRKCLVAGDVYDGHVYHQDPQGRANAQWKIVMMEGDTDGTFHLIDQKHNGAMSALDESDFTGISHHLQMITNGTAQRWVAIPVPMPIADPTTRFSISLWSFIAHIVPQPGTVTFRYEGIPANGNYSAFRLSSRPIEEQPEAPWVRLPVVPFDAFLFQAPQTVPVYCDRLGDMHHYSTSSTPKSGYTRGEIAFYAYPPGALRPGIPAADDTAISPETTSTPAAVGSTYLVKPLVPYATNAPGMAGAQNRVFAIASEQSGHVLTLRDDFQLQAQGTQTFFTDISVGVDGTVWAINALQNHRIYRRRADNTWEVMPGAINQISVGSASLIWGCGPDNSIQRWNGNGWDTIPGWAKNVSVASDGTVWSVSSNADVAYRWTGQTWEQMPGEPRQVSVGSRTSVWCTDAGDSVYRLDGNQWTRTGAAKHVSVAADGAVWSVNNGVISRWRGDSWEVVAGALTHISAGSASNVWGLSSSYSVAMYNAGTGVGRIVQQAWTGDARQKWRLRPNGDRTYRIENVAKAQVLYAETNTTGSEIFCKPWNGHPSQRWKVILFEDGRFLFENVASGLVLQTALPDAGAMAVQSTRIDTGHQRWRLSEVLPAGPTTEPATIHTEMNFGGKATKLAVGSYTNVLLNHVGDRTVASIQVQPGYRVTLYCDSRFDTNVHRFTSNTPNVNDHANQTVYAILVEPVATLYQHYQYEGTAVTLGMGTLNLDANRIPDGNSTALGPNLLSSLKVGPGMMVTVYPERDLKGEPRVYFEDTPEMGNDWNDRAQSVDVQVLGVLIPPNTLRFGAKITFKRRDQNGWLCALHTGHFDIAPAPQAWETFTIVRAGPTQHSSHVSFGDVIAIRTDHNTYISENNGQLGQAGAIGANEKWVVVRTGPSASSVFVGLRDTITLKSARGKYLAFASGGSPVALVETTGSSTQWKLDKMTPPPMVDGRVPPADPNPTLNRCSANVCATEACRADACGAEACGSDSSYVSACGVAANGIATCSVDVAVATACAIAHDKLSVCVVDACAMAACGAAACGAAACMADACGIAACPADACGAAACGIDAIPNVGACAVAGAGIDLCPADACGANVCGINACPADACALDACGIDLIPGLPLI